MPIPPEPPPAPLTFAPRLKDYVWGGRNFERLFGRALPPGVVAESWEVSAHRSAPTLVDEGPLAGVSLAELFACWGTRLAGRRATPAVERGAFPLLFKLLDANQALSVQVHPDDAHAAARHPGETGKTEMWYVLHAEPGAQVVLGFVPDADPSTLRRAAAEGRIEPYLNRAPVRPGDAVFVPAGTVHAILPGIVLAEVQQSSDVTYRLYDWGRPGPEAGGRKLHLKQALAAAGLGHTEGRAAGSPQSPSPGAQEPVPGAQESAPGPQKPVPHPQESVPGVQTPVLVEEADGVRRETLVACGKFVVERVVLDPGAAYEGTLDGETFEAWGVVSGSATVAPTTPRNRGASPTPPPCRLDAVRFALLPATMGDFRVAAAPTDAPTPAGAPTSADAPVTALAAADARTVALRTYLPP